MARTNTRTAPTAPDIDTPVDQANTPLLAETDTLDSILQEFRSVSDENLPALRQRLDDLLAAGSKTGTAYYATLKRSSGRLGQIARHELEHSREVADTYVKENPWRTVAIAGGVAFLGGLLLGRR